MTRFYPVLLDLRDRPCVVVGNGQASEQKVLGLLDVGARVTVISPVVGPRLRELAAEGSIHLILRPYRAGDLDGAFLVIVDANDRNINQAVWAEAEQRRILINAVDDMPHCNVIAPAIHQQGDLTVAVATAGKSPALAVRVRNSIGALLGPEYGTFLDLLGDLRAEVTARVPDPVARRALWYRIVDSDAIEFVRRGDVAGARQRVAHLVADAEPGGAPLTGAGTVPPAVGKGVGT
jgi:siroheme synthase-like protein